MPTHPLFILIFLGENVAYRSLRFRRGFLRLSLVCSPSALWRGEVHENYVTTAFSPVWAHNETRTGRWLNYVRIAPGGDAAMSRARFRLKLYEPAVKCLGDAGQLKFPALRPPLDSDIFAFARKVVLARSFSLIRHSSLSVYMYRSAAWALPRKRGITLASAISRDKSRVDVRGEIRNS